MFNKPRCGNLLIAGMNMILFQWEKIESYCQLCDIEIAIFLGIFMFYRWNEGWNINST